MARDAAADLHRSLHIAGFRALATTAGLLQLCRELEAAGVLPPPAIARIRDAMFHELMEQAPRSLTGDPAFASRLRTRLEKLFSGAATLHDPSVMVPE
jgi:hypothetical protein